MRCARQETRCLPRAHAYCVTAVRLSEPDVWLRSLALFHWYQEVVSHSRPFAAGAECGGRLAMTRSELQALTRMRAFMAQIMGSRACMVRGWKPCVGLAIPVPSAAVLVTQVGGHYDPMIAKVLARGPDRDAALAALHGVLTELEVRVLNSVRLACLSSGLPALQMHASSLATITPYINLAAHPALVAAELDTVHCVVCEFS